MPPPVGAAPTGVSHRSSHGVSRAVLEPIQTRPSESTATPYAPPPLGGQPYCVCSRVVVSVAIVNWIKVPAYVALGQFTFDNMIATAILLPVAVLASVAGVKLVRRVSMERFYTIIYVLMVVAGAKLLFDGLL
jgi:hypothetical protein